jgi:hypothetical protein
MSLSADGIKDLSKASLIMKIYNLLVRLRANVLAVLKANSEFNQHTSLHIKRNSEIQLVIAAFNKPQIM